MKAFIGEVTDPLKDFYKMRKTSEILVVVTVPILFMIVVFMASLMLRSTSNINIYDLCVDFLNQLVTILTLFISFSMAYLSIIITSSSNNIDGLKGTESKKYSIDGKKCTLYQVLHVDLTYTLVIQIFFLAMVLFERFLICVIDKMVIRFIIAVDVAGMVHVLLMMLIIVKNIYYSFWKSE